jgi:hypothetical protein
VSVHEPPVPAVEPDDKHRLTALEGLAALSLDALSSAAYGPEAIVVVLVAAGTASVTYPDAAAQPQSSAPKGSPGQGDGVRGSRDDGG